MGAYEGPTNFLNVGAAPSLMLNFAREKSLEDQISGKDLITFLRSSVGTYVGADGLIKTAAADEPRFDHDANGNCLGLLIEEQRFNRVSGGLGTSIRTTNYLGDTSGTGWTMTANAGVAPDGTTTATLLSQSQGLNNYDITWITGIMDSGRTFSVFVKHLSGSVNLHGQFGSGDLFTVNLDTGVNNASPTGRIRDIQLVDYPNGWKRLSIYAVDIGPTAGELVGTAIFLCMNNAASDILLWGWQVEDGTFPTSHIPTVNSAATREPDIAQITGTNFTDWYNATEGTIFTEFSAKGSNTAGYPGVYWFNNNLTASRGFALLKETGPQTRVFQRGDDAVLKRVSFSENIPDSTFTKASVFYTNSEIGGSQNNEFQSPTSITSPYSVNRLYIGYHNSGGGVAPLHLNSHIKQLIYYPARISDIKLQQMTKVFS